VHRQGKAGAVTFHLLCPRSAGWSAGWDNPAHVQAHLRPARGRLQRPVWWGHRGRGHRPPQEDPLLAARAAGHGASRGRGPAGPRARLAF